MSDDRCAREGCGLYETAWIHGHSSQDTCPGEHHAFVAPAPVSDRCPTCAQTDCSDERRCMGAATRTLAALREQVEKLAAALREIEEIAGGYDTEAQVIARAVLEGVKP